MRARNFDVPLLALLCAVAAMFGWATAPSADAGAQYITMNIHPGTEAGTATLFCGWHGTCLYPYPAGDALDWQNSSGDDPEDMHSVYLRTRTSYDGSATVGGYGQAFDDNSTTCKGIGVEIKRPSGAILGYVYNKHSEDVNTWQFTISAGATPILLASYVGVTAWEEDCTAWDGAHLHQRASDPPDWDFEEHWSEYPYAPTPQYSVPITNASKYQDYVSFEY